MLYKILCCAAVLLIGTPPTASAQQVSPLVVETLRSTAPTTNRTGEPFIQVYKITFLDLSKGGKQVEIFEDEVRPKSFPAPLGNFEILEWVMDKSDIHIVKGEDADEHNWYLNLTLRIINPKKGAYVIPKIKFRWAIVPAGQDVKGVESKEFETDEVPINYVTTVTQDPYLDIRDKIYLTDYSWQTSIFWVLSRVIAPIMVLVPIVFGVRSFRLRRKLKRTNDSIKTSTQDGEPILVVGARVSFGSAYRSFFREIHSLSRGRSDRVEDPVILLATEKKLSKVLRDLLVAKLERVNPGDTTKDIGNYIEKTVKPGVNKQNLLYLQQVLAEYQLDIEAGYPFHLPCFPTPKTNKLKRTIRSLKWYWLILYSIFPYSDHQE